jgi:outer membrane protein assembly factor BamB
MPTNRFPDEEIAPVASALKRIYDRRSIDPGDRFITTLGQKLATATAPGELERSPIERSADGFRIPLVPEHRQRNRTRSQLVAVLTILLLLAGSTFFTLRPESTDHSDEAPAIANNTQSTPNPLAKGGIRWSIPGSSGPDVSIGEIAVGGGVLYRALTRPDFSGIQAIAAKDGSLLWEVPVRNAGQMIAVDNRLFIASNSPDGTYRVVCLNRENGEQHWATMSLAPIRDIAVQDGTVIVQDEENGITGLREETGLGRWWVPGDESGDDSTAIVPQLVSAPGIVIALSASHGLTAYDPQSGDALWSLSSIYANQLAISGNTIAMIEGIYPSNSTYLEGQITGYSTDDGTKLWQRTISQPAFSPMPTLATDVDGFVVIANEVGTVIVSLPPGSTPDLSDLSSNTLIFGRMEVSPPPFALVYGLNTESGGITWFSRSELGRNIQVRSVKSDVWLIAPPAPGSYRGFAFASTIDGQVGWLVGDTSTSPFEPASRMFVGPDYDLPMRVGAQINQVVQDLTTAYVKTENGTVIAIDSGSL